ncbi:MAG: LemA family protein [Candidatus Hadarchaeum sp.]|uniref:LemA family protein n=1 Tax=Candidatus Hadarchaeum sp. TaxID=2883567 RepID=UPI003174ABFC
MWEWILIIIVVIVLLVIVALFFNYYNRIISLSNRIDNAWAQIDVQLKKRADLVPNLVETVKGYMAHEKKAIEMVTKARERMMGAQTVKDKMDAGVELAAAMKTIFALAENYPNLKASENFKLLQEQLDGIESKIAYARQFYNDSVLAYNNAITTFPGRWFAQRMGRTEQKPYFEITEKERAVPKVTF